MDPDNASRDVYFPTMLLAPGALIRTSSQFWRMMRNMLWFEALITFILQRQMCLCLGEIAESVQMFFICSDISENNGKSRTQNDCANNERKS